MSLPDVLPKATNTALNLLGFKGTATYKLYRLVIWSLLQELGRAICYRCNGPLIEGEFHLDHKQPWRYTEDPIGLFFDLNNVAFSHPKCNLTARKVVHRPSVMRTHCKRGHIFDVGNTYLEHRRDARSGRPYVIRNCRSCHREREAARRRGLGY